MNDEKRRPGRPLTKHLHDNHHFKAESAITEESPAVEIAENPIVETAEVHSQEFTSEVNSLAVHVEIASNPVLESHITHAESPVEKKIHALMETASLNGWKLLETEVLINTPPRNGIPIKVSETTQGDGIIVFWKRLRAFANATKRWQENGAWIDFHTGMKIAFEPKYWKERF